jgi:hypothetical protein
MDLVFDPGSLPDQVSAAGDLPRLQQAAGTDPHPLSEHIGGTGNDWDEFTND